MSSSDIEKARNLLTAGCYAEAIPLFTAAVAECPADHSLWLDLVHAASLAGQPQAAADFCQEGLRHHPQSDWLWRQLGSALTVMDQLDEAENALRNAHSLNSNAVWLWRYFAKLHNKQKNCEKEIEALEVLARLGEADANDINQLGIAYAHLGNNAQAIKFYRYSVALAADPAPLFNMGLAFSHPEVSQDVDAADAYRRALALDPDYDHAQEQLAATKRKLVPLAERARGATRGFVRSDEYFQFYLNPFEALQLDVNEPADELDVKGIQRAKRRLLQEIALNDNKVSWLGDCTLDQSRALALVDELDNEDKRRYHWAVFQNKRLLRFLTHGDIEHFFFADDYFPQETLNLLDEEAAFRSFLSQPFARQYNLVLTRAIERRVLPVIEALFDGRRWVNAEDEDVCFEGAAKRVGDLVEVMRAKAEEGRRRKISVHEIEDVCQQHALPEIFNLLPVAFRSVQTALVTEIRSLAISCCNEHGDLDLSQAVLDLCHKFHFKSTELNQLLDKDFQTIEQMIAEERKHETRLSFGAGRSFAITKEGIRDGNTFFPAHTIQGLRWGISVTGYTGRERYEYLFAVKDDTGESIAVVWSTDQSSEAEQTAFFTSMINAALNYLAAAALEKMQKRMESGQSIVIGPGPLGPCTLTPQGIAFKTQGLIFKKERFLPWADVSTEVRNGQIIVSSIVQSGIETTLSMRDINNAVLLPLICTMMKKESA
jgi:tetratricopeptide repeat protein